MGDLLFDRKVKVTYGKPGGEAIAVEKLLMQFNIEKSLEAEPNKGIINIYNLNLTSRGFLQQKDLSVVLEAGYGTIVGQLAAGKISHSFTEKQGKDAVTRIEFEDGGERYLKSRISKTLAAGVTNKQVMEAIASSLQVGVGTIKGIDEGSFQHGMALFGNSKDLMDDITGRMGLEWSIQDEKLQVLPPNTPSDVLGILLTTDTGLIGSPTEREDSKNGGKFIEFDALLRPEIKPGVAVQIASKRVDGTFKIRRAKYQGDSRTGPFKVTCEAVEIETAAIETSDTLNLTGTPVETLA